MEEAIQATRAWVEQFVIGLHLCPFAARPAREGKIRYVADETGVLADMLHTFLQELEHLVTQPREALETTLIVYTNGLDDFAQFLDFVTTVEALLTEGGVEGLIQVASFHPAYRFAGAAADDPANYTNRSPYPMIHLIREESVEEAREQHPDVAGIPERNISLLREMGLSTILEKYVHKRT